MKFWSLCILVLVWLTFLEPPSYSIAAVTNIFDSLHRIAKIQNSNGTIIQYFYDEAGNMTRKIVTTPGGTDNSSPIITTFTAPSTSQTLTITGITLIATDNIGVAGYMLTESNTSPAASSSDWSPSSPTQYTFASAGGKILYAWAKDAAGNVSNYSTATVTITLLDTTPPTITSFNMPASEAAMIVPVISFTATDDVGVTGYCISEKSDPSGCVWASEAPDIYPFTTSGIKILHAWTKDAAGNISQSASATINVSLSARITTVPIVNTPYTTYGNDTPVMAVDVSGNLHLAYIYTSDTTQPDRISTYKLYYMKQVNGSWTNPIMLKKNVNYQDDLKNFGVSSFTGLKMAIDSNSNPHFTWVNGISGNGNPSDNNSEIYYAWYDGNSFSTPVNVSNNNYTGVLNFSNIASPPESSGGQIRLASVGNDIYAMGFDNFLRLYRYNTLNNTWSRMADAASIYGADDGDLKSLNGLVYAVDSSGHFQAYDPSTNSWSPKANLLDSGQGIRLAAINGKMYAVGASNSNIVQVYDPATNTWTYKTPMPTARYWPAVVVYNGKLIVIGGNGATVEAFDPTANTWDVWSNLDYVPYTGKNSAAVVNNRIYYAGGGHYSIALYDPLTSAWEFGGKSSNKINSGDIASVNGKIYIIDNNSFQQITISGFKDSIPTMSYSPIIRVGLQNKIHIFWIDGEYRKNEWNGSDWKMKNSQTSYTYYKYYDSDSKTWSDTSMLNPNGTLMDAVVGSDNTQHIVYKLNDTTQSKYLLKYMNNKGAGWSVPITAIDYGKDFESVSLALDRQNNLALASVNANDNLQQRLVYCKQQGDVWGNPEIIQDVVSGLLYYNPTLLVANNNSVVVEYNTSTGLIYECQKPQGGTWSNSRLLASINNNSGSYAFSTAYNFVTNLFYFSFSADFMGHNEINLNRFTMDSVAPTISIFTAPAISNSLTVSNIVISASDDVEVTGYTLTETATVPDLVSSAWNAAPTQYTFSSSGNKILYAWAKDASGNVSIPVSVAITINLPVNGVCGSSNGGFFIAAPTVGLCSAGISSGVVNSDLWTWTCQGLFGGVTSNCSATHNYTLSVTISGGGGGAINSNPSNLIYCTYSPQVGNCSTSMAFGNAVSLFATADNKSRFGGWSNSCGVCSGISCVITLRNDVNCIATFTTAPKAIVGGKEFNSLQSAYTDIDTETGSNIEVLEGVSTGDFIADKKIEVLVNGGNNTEFTTHNSSTIIYGSLTVRNGSLSINNLIVGPQAPVAILGDINDDGKVDMNDYNILHANYGQTNCGNIADINKDCKVDALDYNILHSNFGLSAW